jgi:hypothetical protein
LGEIFNISININIISVKAWLGTMVLLQDQKLIKKLGNDEHEFNTIVQACGGAKIDVPYIIGHEMFLALVLEYIGI